MNFRSCTRKRYAGTCWSCAFRPRDPAWSLNRPSKSTRFQPQPARSLLLQKNETTMMASSKALRLAALSSRGHAPSGAAAALPISASNYFSSVPSIAASQNTLNQKRTHHFNASPSSTQFFSSAQWNGCNLINTSLRNSYNNSILNNSGNNEARWFSSKSENEEDQALSDAQQTPVDEEATTTASGTSQHSTWVEFQKSISVSGFETGQTVREQTFGKKSRGGKIDRKRKEREAELEAALRGADNTQVS